MFISYVNDSHKIKLNEESIDYKWCDKEEFINLINWYDDKETLKQILEKYI